MNKSAVAARARVLAARGHNADSILQVLLEEGAEERIASNQANIAAHAALRSGILPRQEPEAAHVTVEDFPNDPFLRLPLSFIEQRMADFSGNEFKVLVYILRRTIGFHKESDTISIAQFADGLRAHDGRVLDRGTGLSRRTVCRVLDSLEEQGVLVRERGLNPDGTARVTRYRLLWKRAMSK